MKFTINKATKKIAVVLSMCLICGTVGGVAYSAGNDSGAGSTAKALNNADTAASAALTAADSLKSETAISKNETVYVIADASGSKQNVIVSDELKNTLGSKSITDSSNLADIKNVKGSETFTKNSDGTISWDAEGNDIYYQGTSEKALPMQVAVSFTLDGSPVSPADIAGKSGKVCIRFDYKTDTVATGNTELPFLAVTALTLDNNNFKNVVVSSGKIIDDGNHSIVVGYAVPGLQDGLGLGGDTLKIPDYVEVTADVTKFTLESTLTYASCDYAQDIDTSKIDSVGDLTGALNQVDSAVTQLTDGSSALYNGLDTLLEKSGEMSDGIGTLSSGAAQLSNGLRTLDSNSATLKSGAYQVFTTLTTEAQTQLNAALKANGQAGVTLTPETYGTVLTGILDQFSNGAYSKASAAAEAQIRPAVEAAVREQVAAGVKATVKAQLITKGYTAAQAEAYLGTDAGAAVMKPYIDGKMASDEIKATIDGQVKQKLASDDVQAQIKAAVSSGLKGNASYSAIASLKTSLDSYAAFYNGLCSYTAGVSSAAGGAEKLSSGLGQLKTGSGSLVSGVSQLRDGAKLLSDGICEFSNQISSKLGSLSKSQLKDVIPRIDTMLRAAKNYTNFSGIADGETGSVKFVIKTASIGD